MADKEPGVEKTQKNIAVIGGTREPIWYILAVSQHPNRHPPFIVMDARTHKGVIMGFIDNTIVEAGQVVAKAVFFVTKFVVRLQFLACAAAVTTVALGVLVTPLWAVAQLFGAQR